VEEEEAAVEAAEACDASEVMEGATLSSDMSRSKEKGMGSFIRSRISRSDFISAIMRAMRLLVYI
jgi:hypothetical protein